MTEAARWLEQARRDLDDARYAAAGARWNLACFLAQQAAEKALKAYHYARGAEAVWGHSVAELCQEAAAHDGAFADLAGEAAALDQYYIPTRYPNGLPGGIPADAYNRADGDRALALCARVIDPAGDRAPRSE
jgi:HEPN domain-containing protein